VRVPTRGLRECGVCLNARSAALLTVIHTDLRVKLVNTFLCDAIIIAIATFVCIRDRSIVVQS
jgi:hypothetical protein